MNAEIRNIEYGLDGIFINGGWVIPETGELSKTPIGFIGYLPATLVSIALRRNDVDCIDYLGFRISKHKLPSEGEMYTFSRSDGRWSQRWYKNTDQLCHDIKSAHHSIMMNWGKK